MSRAATWFSATVIAVAMAAAPAMFSEIDDHSADYTTSAELQALQATERGTQRREAAAQALCHAERGPQSEARWTVDGDLVCTQRRNAPASTGKVMEARL